MAANVGTVHALVRRLLDPGPPGGPPLVVRLVVAAVFIPIGLGKFVNHDAYVERFERWGFGELASQAAYLTGTTEVVGGLLILVGLAPRLAALGLIGTMIGALATAGRIDGGQDVWLPLVMIALLAVLVVRGAGSLALGRRLLPG